MGFKRISAHLRQKANIFSMFRGTVFTMLVYQNYSLLSFLSFFPSLLLISLTFSIYQFL